MAKKNLHDLPRLDDLTGWRTWVVDVTDALNADPISLEDYVNLGRLWRRVLPPLEAWNVTLQGQRRRSVMRGPNETFETADDELVRLIQDVYRVIGRLQLIARETQAGSPEFPRMTHTGPR